MDQTISHEEAYASWSSAQLEAFRNMTPQARLDALKTGALEHWTPDDRDAALDLMADAPQQAEQTANSTPRRFEPATAALPPITLHPPRFDRLIAAALAGWLIIAVGLTGHVFGPY